MEKNEKEPKTKFVDIENVMKHPLHKKMKFSIKDFFSKCDQIRSFLFTEEILNGKLQFFVQWPLLIYNSSKIYSTCRSINIIDNFFSTGIYVSYDRIFELRQKYMNIC